MLKDGRLLAVECKAKGGRLRPEQKEFLSLVRRFGGVAFVAHDCRDVSQQLTKGGEVMATKLKMLKPTMQILRGRVPMLKTTRNPETVW